MSKEDESKKKDDGKTRKASELIAEEEVKTGRVHFSILLAYGKACTWPMTLLTLLFYAATNVASVGGNFWLAVWSNAESRALEEGPDNFTQGSACDVDGGTSM